MLHFQFSKTTLFENFNATNGSGNGTTHMVIGTAFCLNSGDKPGFYREERTVCL